MKNKLLLLLKRNDKISEEPESFQLVNCEYSQH